MSRNSLTLVEQETVILWDNASKEAKVYTHDKKLISRLRELEEQFPKEYRLIETGPQRAVTYLVPKRYVTVRSPYNEDRRQQQIADAKDNKYLFRKKEEAADG